MKILYITNGINGAGGLERVLAIKASYLADQLQYEVHILTLNEPEHKPFYVFSSEVHFHSIPVKGSSLLYSINYIKGIKKIINQVRPNIISVCDDGLKAFFLPLFLGDKLPLVYERHVSKAIGMHGNFSSIKKIIVRIKWFMMSVLARRFDAFVVLTKGNLSEWKNVSRIKVIANPLSFYPPVSSELKSKKVIAVGKHGYQKGYDMLLVAWKQVVSQCLDWELEIYGKVDPKENLIELANKLGIEGKVHFFSPIQEIEKKYLDASIFVLSSRFEGFGMVLIEAMSCGLPCISFDCEHGPADIISDHVDGLLVSNGDIEGLGRALISLIENEELRRKMGETAKENVKRYLPEHIMPIWDDLFQQLVYAHCL